MKCRDFSTLEKHKLCKGVVLTTLDLFKEKHQDLWSSNAMTPDLLIALIKIIDMELQPSNSFAKLHEDGIGSFVRIWEALKDHKITMNEFRDGLDAFAVHNYFNYPLLRSLDRLKLFALDMDYLQERVCELLDDFDCTHDDNLVDAIRTFIDLLLNEICSQFRTRYEAQSICYKDWTELQSKRANAGTSSSPHASSSTATPSRLIRSLQTNSHWWQESQQRRNHQFSEGSRKRYESADTSDIQNERLYTQLVEGFFERVKSTGSSFRTLFPTLVQRLDRFITPCRVEIEAAFFASLFCTHLNELPYIINFIRMKPCEHVAATEVLYTALYYLDDLQIDVHLQQQGLTREEKALVDKVFEKPRMQFLEDGENAPELVEILWNCFHASGDTHYLDRLVGLATSPNRASDNPNEDEPSWEDSIEHLKLSASVSLHTFRKMKSVADYFVANEHRLPRSFVELVKSAWANEQPPPPKMPPPPPDEDAIAEQTTLTRQ